MKESVVDVCGGRRRLLKRFNVRLVVVEGFDVIVVVNRRVTIGVRVRKSRDPRGPTNTVLWTVHQVGDKVKNRCFLRIR